MGLAFRSGILPERGRAFFLLDAGGEGTSVKTFIRDGGVVS